MADPIPPKVSTLIPNVSKATDPIVRKEINDIFNQLRVILAYINKA